MIRWKDLSAERQMDLRAAYEIEMAKQSKTCSLDEKVARFAEWLAPQGIAFDFEDLAARC
ncbi:hypothetical protein [Thioclava atlantica]|uniref:Uncharacterized protein n=1 Tax=Thioclava atlantica TaxID=1317124 RepID=A0A085TYV0_9RHOB|nr:hypothetical protein [Thioclava atlantica]KFE35897.1 hypothetical protein DW2_04690 [Thioclava atlantica]